MSNDYIETIKTLLLEKLPRSQVKNGSVFICCPFHEEATPSCAVTLVHPKYSPGTYYCFGCGESGGWNKLAKKVGFTFLVNQSELAASMKGTIQSIGLDQDYLRISEESIEDFVRNQHFDGFDLWPEGENWRSINWTFLKSIGAYKIFEFDEQKVFLPVKVNSKLVGGLRASLDRKKYLTTRGNWVKEKGLFPFDVTKKLIKDKKWIKKFVVLVEGPRDAARLVINNIPALAILGSKQWSDIKTDLLMSIIYEDFDIILMFDSDDAGKEATKLVKENLKSYANLKTVKLPEFTKENGKVTKCDVFNLSDKKFNAFIKILNSTYT